MLAERLFGDMENWPGVPIGRAEFTGGVRNDRREFEQAHWCLGLPGLTASDARLPALSLFVQALGGGMSSRLFRSCARTAASLTRSAPGARPMATPKSSR